MTVAKPETLQARIEHTQVIGTPGSLSLRVKYKTNHPLHQTFVEEYVLDASTTTRRRLEILLQLAGGQQCYAKLPVQEQESHYAQALRDKTVPVTFRYFRIEGFDYPRLMLGHNKKG